MHVIGKVKEALKMYQLALRIDPDNSETLYNNAIALYNSGFGLFYA